LASVPGYRAAVGIVSSSVDDADCAKPVRLGTDVTGEGLLRGGVAGEGSQMLCMGPESHWLDYILLTRVSEL